MGIINSNRYTKRLEIAVTQTKQTTEVSSNRDKMRGVSDAMNGSYSPEPLSAATLALCGGSTRSGRSCRDGGPEQASPKYQFPFACARMEETAANCRCRRRAEADRSTPYQCESWLRQCAGGFRRAVRVPRTSRSW